MFFTKSAVAAALLSIAVAKPTPVEILEERDASATVRPLTVQKFRKTFTIEQQAKEDADQSVVAPAIAIANTFAKYGVPVSSKVQRAAKSAQQQGSVIAVPQQYDMSYLCPVSIGGLTMNLNFDTGSSDLWVFSSLQPANQTQGRSTVYNPNRSPNAARLSGATWSIGYGDGSGASGVVYTDTVAIGPVTATSMAVEAATSASSQFLADPHCDGLVGLAFSNLNTVQPTQQKTFFDVVKSSLASPVFTSNLKKGAPGSYDFGFVNASKYSGPITYAPVPGNSGFWLIQLGGYKIQGQNRVFTSMGQAIVDTGTSLLYLPQNVVDNYWASVPGAYNSNSMGGYIYPCINRLPRFNIGIRGRLFQLPGNYLNYAPLSSPMRRDTMCFGGLQSNAGIGFSILGDIFLKSVFVIFDQTQSQPRIGFAKQR